MINNLTRKAIYFLTGSSGSGKTTLLQNIAQTLPTNVAYFHFDSDASLEIEDWFNKAMNCVADIVILDGSKKPTEVIQVARQKGIVHLKIILIDCSHIERKRRLVEERLQPELDTLDMYAWAAYLRGQADVLELEIIDTTSASVRESTKQLLGSIERFSDEVLPREATQ